MIIDQENVTLAGDQVFGRVVYINSHKYEAH